MAFENAIILMYIGVPFILIYTSSLFEDLRYMPIKIFLIGVALLILLSGFSQSQSILDQQNYTSTVINESVSYSMSQRFETNYRTLLWSIVIFLLFIFGFFLYELFNYMKTIPKGADRKDLKLEKRMYKR